jgi:2-succinyl-5-enolpyruvyl-6-hydroxy-3-cyclohexene-1-carboxylate synthase
MSEAAANTLWARSFVDELARAGMREAVVAPGSRSTPLVMALAREGRVRTRVHLDERSAGFFALGVGKATGRPAAVVTTSGTAVANLLPAVVEASRSGVPLLVLSADRPHRLRGADANQAIDQVGIFGRYVRAFHEMAPPRLEGPALRHVRVVADRAWMATTGPDAGPVHVNFPFAKPLEPAEPDDAFVAEHPVAATGRDGDEPYTTTARGGLVLPDDELEALLSSVDPGHGVIVAGPCEGADRLAPKVVRFAAATGFPLLADPLSGARYGPARGAHVVAGYDLFLRDHGVREGLRPSLIVRVGASPTSAALQAWLLQHTGVEHVVVDAGGRWKDHGATATRYLLADPADVLRRATGRWTDPSEPASAPARADLAWADLWNRADAAAREAMADHGCPEGRIAADIVDALPPGAGLFVSSSMPVRDVDAFGHPRESPVAVFANRGASGVDGVVSSAFGVASQRDGPTVCLLGDIAFFHDRNGLLWSREPDAPVVFVLVDNDGGGIFHMLPIADHEPEFTRLFATPHGVDPRPVAAAHRIPFTDTDPGDVASTLAKALQAGETTILRVRTDRAANRRARARVEDDVPAAVRAALESG